jgi:hypothetical protein
MPDNVRSARIRGPSPRRRGSPMTTASSRAAIRSIPAQAGEPLEAGGSRTASELPRWAAGKWRDPENLWRQLTVYQRRKAQNLDSAIARAIYPCDPNGLQNVRADYAAAQQLVEGGYKILHTQSEAAPKNRSKKRPKKITN